MVGDSSASSGAELQLTLQLLTDLQRRLKNSEISSVPKAKRCVVWRTTSRTLIANWQR